MSTETNSTTNDYKDRISVPKSRRNFNIILAICSMIFACILYFYLIPKYVGSSFATGVSPDFFPKVYAILIFLIALFQLLVIILKPESVESDGDLEEWPKDRKKRGFFAIGFVVLYVFVLIEYFGYFIATPIALIVSFFLLGERSPFKLFLVSTIFSIIVFVLFEMMLNIYLPRGYLWS